MRSIACSHLAKYAEPANREKSSCSGLGYVEVLAVGKPDVSVSGVEVEAASGRSCKAAGTWCAVVLAVVVDEDFMGRRGGRVGGDVSAHSFIYTRI